MSRPAALLRAFPIVALSVTAAFTGDWPTYQADPERSAVCAERLEFPLGRVWEFASLQAPSPAWPEPGKELHRLDFDYSFQPIVAEGKVFFGSSADDAVRALDAAPVPFERSVDRTDPVTTLFVRRDDKALYFAYRRAAPVVSGKAMPFVATQEGEDIQWWVDDDFEVSITDSTGATAAFFGVACGGGWFDGTKDLAAGRSASTTWDGQWQRAVKRSEKEWSAEAAIPFATLAAAGVSANGLRLNAKSQNQSGVGAPVIFLTDPGARYLIDCTRFLAVTDKDPAADSAVYTVRLHTAERKALQPGQRVFDITVQGQPLIKGLDIAKETGGAGIPLVKELKGVAAGRTLRVDLTPVEGKELPLLCGMEVVRE